MVEEGLRVPRHGRELARPSLIGLQIFSVFPGAAKPGLMAPGTEDNHPHAAKLSWPLVVDFMAREVDGLTFSEN